MGTHAMAICTYRGQPASGGTSKVDDDAAQAAQAIHDAVDGDGVEGSTEVVAPLCFLRCQAVLEPALDRQPRRRRVSKQNGGGGTV